MSPNTRVLIADDHPHALHGLRAMLAASPAIEIVGEAAHGREAVEQAEKCRPDVVVMDARMPVMDGLEATRLIKKRQPEVRVIVLPMYPLHRGEALAAGADAFLVKGCSADELRAAIMEC